MKSQILETQATLESERTWTKWRFDKRLGKRKFEQQKSKTFIKIEPGTEIDDDKSIEYWRTDENSWTVEETFVKIEPGTVDDDKSIEYWRPENCDWQVRLIPHNSLILSCLIF